MSTALAGTLTLDGPGRIERPQRLSDRETPFEQVAPKTVRGEGWFRIRGLGVPYFVFLGPDDEATVDVSSRTATGSTAVQQQLVAQWKADDLRPQDLRQLKRAHKGVEKALDDPSERTRALGEGRLLMVVAESQQSEIGMVDDWLSRAHDALPWTDATPSTPAFVDFAVEVGLALRRKNDLEASLARVSEAEVPGVRTLTYGVLEASVDCCVTGQATASAVRSKASAWPVLYERLDALRPHAEASIPALSGTTLDGAAATLPEGRVLVVLWDPEDPSAFDGIGLLRQAFPSLQVLALADTSEPGTWKAAVRALDVDGVTHVLEPGALDRWYATEGPRYHGVVDGHLVGPGFADPLAVRAWLEEAP